VRPDRVDLAQSVEDFAVEQLVAQASVEALDVAVLPGAASLDVGGLGTDNRDPFLHCLGEELRSVVGPGRARIPGSSGTGDFDTNFYRKPRRAKLGAGPSRN